MEQLQERVTGIEKAIEVLVKEMQDIKGILTSGFEKVDGNFEKVHQKIDALRGNTTQSLEAVEANMKLEFADLKEEIGKIANTYPYDALNDNLKIIKN